jgi:hypothetical protein
MDWIALNFFKGWEIREINSGTPRRLFLIILGTLISQTEAVEKSLDPLPEPSFHKKVRAQD